MWAPSSSTQHCHHWPCHPHSSLEDLATHLLLRPRALSPSRVTSVSTHITDPTLWPPDYLTSSAWTICLLFSPLASGQDLDLSSHHLPMLHHRKQTSRLGPLTCLVTHYYSFNFFILFLFSYLLCTGSEGNSLTITALSWLWAARLCPRLANLINSSLHEWSHLCSWMTPKSLPPPPETLPLSARIYQTLYTAASLMDLLECFKGTLVSIHSKLWVR